MRACAGVSCSGVAFLKWVHYGARALPLFAPDDPKTENLPDRCRSLRASASANASTALMSAGLLALGHWLAGFAFTQAVEVPLYLRLTGSWRLSLGAAALTHPVGWFLFPLLPLPHWAMLSCAEAFAVVVQGAWLRWHGVDRSYFLSALVSGASFTVGLLLHQAFGAP